MDEPELNEKDFVDAKAVHTMLALARTAKGSKGAFYRAAGQHLDMLRQGKTQEHWTDIVREHCGLSRRRAYELISLAKRKKSLPQIRAEKAASMKRARAKSKS